MKNVLKLLAIAAAIALTGCSESAIQSAASCKVITTQICARAAESQLRHGTLAISYTFQPEDARVVPFVVPVFDKKGTMAAEVDCYANTDSHSYSIVQSDLSIPPASEESVAYLREQRLCADDGSYAQDEYLRVETASALPTR
jgi:hypothetical protein